MPQIAAIIWVVKILTTGMSETTSDFPVHRIDPPVALALGPAIFGAVLAAQWAAPWNNAWIQWAAVLSVSIFGTMTADVLHVGLAIACIVSAIFFSAALAVIFATWYFAEGTLSIHGITAKRRETFYWAIVLATLAPARAAEDMSTTSLELGF